MHVPKPADSYAVTVIGAGMVGASFALALQQLLGKDTSTLVVEAGGIETRQTASPAFDDRSTALSYGSSRILQQIGLWDALAGHLTPIETIHVSDRGHFGSSQLNCASEGVPALGYVVENRRFGQVLGDALVTGRGLDLMAPAAVTAIRPLAQGMQLTLSTESGNSLMVDTGLVVLADGGRSPICSQLGIVTDREEYGQSAIIGNIAFERPHDKTAFERFTDTGPLAVLPLASIDGQNRGALVWTVAQHQAEKLLGLDEPLLLDLLQERFGYRLGRITRFGQRACFPLSLQVAREQVRPGLVLLGNVAHTLHPVAGQGFNLALRDAQRLAEVLGGAMQRQQQPGSMDVLQEFVEQQRQDQARTIGFSHYLTRLFSSRRNSLIWARKFGLATIDMLPAVRHGFARTAMGLADR